MNDSVELAPEIKRLRWRCRRGTRELDQLLSGWLTDRWENADGEARAAFANMLECADPDLWNWLTGREAPRDPAIAHIVDEIRAVHRV